MTDFDPFDDAPEDTEETTPEPEPKPEPKKTARKTTKKETKPVAEQDENRQSKLSITLKGGAGFDAPWLVLYPDSLEEARELLGEENRETLKEVLELTQKASQFFISKGSGSAPAPRNGGNGGGGRGNAPQGAQEHPEGRREFCEHGEMKYMSGVSKKTGKPYKMFVCQSGDRNNECRPKSA